MARGIWGYPIKDLPFKLAVQSHVEIWRAADFWTKEPETISWIDGFEPGSTFWDVGANIGVFSLYAAKMGAARVLAFEPERNNFLAIIENAELNDFSWLSGCQYAISDIDGRSVFFLPYSGSGLSGGQIGAAVNDHGEPFTPAESYEVEVHSIDTLCSVIFDVPNYIKIDVDGNEFKILSGADKTLSRKEVKSVLVEVNSRHFDIECYMTDHGFTSNNRFNDPKINKRIQGWQHNKIYTRDGG